MSGPTWRSRWARFAVAVVLGLGVVIASPARAARDYATVGRIVTRVVEGRTVVLVPIAGTMRLRLSEPFRLNNRSRLYLTIVDAKLGIPVPPRKGEGVLGMEVTERDGDVRIAIDFRALGDYGMKPTEGGILLWVDPEPPLRAAPADPAVVPAGVKAPERMEAKASPQESQGGGIAGLLILSGLAAIAGVGVRTLRTEGGAQDLKDRFDQALAWAARRQTPKAAESTGVADR
jgi:hypothetical protein